MTTLTLVVTEFVVLSVACGLLMRYYKSPMVSFDVTTTVYLAWVLGFSGVLLLPYDISLAIVDNTRSDILDIVWQVLYWSTFFLAWFVLPLQMEYHKSGEFSFCGKLTNAIRKHFIMGCLAAIAGTAYLIYMLFTTGLSLNEVVAFGMAMSSTYGIVVIIVLMGNGLVAIPRRLWQLGDSQRELRRLYLSVCVYNIKLPCYIHYLNHIPYIIRVYIIRIYT